MPPDYDYDQLFPGRFMKAGEFKGREVTLTIKDVELEEMEEKRGTKTKCIVSFHGTKKQLVLNRTNGECLKGMFGRKVAAWVGKRVTFFPVTVEAFGAPTLAIRVKGSPDIQADMQITAKVGRNGDVKVTMKKTALRQAQQQQQQQQAAAPPPPSAPPAPTPEANPDYPEPFPADMDQDTGEVPFS